MRTLNVLEIQSVSGGWFWGKSNDSSSSSSTTKTTVEGCREKHKGETGHQGMSGKQQKDYVDCHLDVLQR